MKNYIKTGQSAFDDLIPMVRAFLEKDILELNIDGEKVRGYRSPDAKSLWIRDHSDMMRAAKYFETDLKSAVDHFAITQAVNGRIFDYVTTHPEKLPCEKENWTKYVRVPVEADVEFRFIKAAYLAWQANGDDDWMIGLLPAMEKAIDYIFTNPQRVDAASGLVKRAYTIDTWDFAYTAGKHSWLQFQIDENTYWGIFHGDNSGYYEALNILAAFYSYLDNRTPLSGFIEEPGPGSLKVQGLKLKARASLKRAERLKAKMNEVGWNGRFYTHFVKLVPVEIKGVDESEQLSLSNPMAINRGMATHEQAVSILKEYIARERSTKAFAGWFSIDPPFPDGIFGDEKLVGGAYINGGIFPLAGGELAMAAFNHGFETYGVEILKKYYRLISEKSETFLWYFPDGTPCSEENSTSPEAMPTDGWGSSAMAWALIEGLAGVEDRLKGFSKVRLSPRWHAADINEAGIGVAYPGDGVGVRYQYKKSKTAVEIDLDCDSDVDFHVLLAPDDVVSGITVNGLFPDYEIEIIEQSQYINFSAGIKDRAQIRITFRG